MVELDSLKIEQVIDRCWLFFAEYGQMSERYKNMHKNGEPDPDQVSLQRDCFKNGSVAHKTIAQWRRNAELLILHQSLLKRQPFTLDVWLVASYV